MHLSLCSTEVDYFSLIFFVTAILWISLLPLFLNDAFNTSIGVSERDCIFMYYVIMAVYGLNSMYIIKASYIVLQFPKMLYAGIYTIYETWCPDVGFKQVLVYTNPFKQSRRCLMF